MKADEGIVENRSEFWPYVIGISVIATRHYVGHWIHAALS
jgi:hypothetical protein